MSQHGCPERLSNRSKGFQEDGSSQPTMEVLVETLTGTAFEMTVSPSDTIFAIKSKIFRVEGIPVSQQHLVYNLRELEDGRSLRELCIGDGARLRLVLGMRGGPVSTRRLPPPQAEPWRDIERLLDTTRDESEWGGNGCKVTVLVFRDGERVNMLRVKENHDGTYSPLEHTKYSSSLPQLSECEADLDAEAGAEAEAEAGVSGSLQQNARTMGKMLELRARMETLSLQRHTNKRITGDKPEIQKTRSEETLSVPNFDDSEPYKSYSQYDESFAPLYDGNFTRYDYDYALSDRYTLLPPIGTRSDSDQSVHEAVESERIKLSDALAGSILVKGRREREDEAAILEECLDSAVEECHIRQDSPQLAANNLAPIPAAEYGPLVGGSGGGWLSRGFGSSSQLHAHAHAHTHTHAAHAHTHAAHAHAHTHTHEAHAHSHSASSLHMRVTLPPPKHHPPLSDALFSSSTSDLENLNRNTRMLPALSRHRNREHLHLSDERLELELPPRRLDVGSERRARRPRGIHAHAHAAPRGDAQQHAALTDTPDIFPRHLDKRDTDKQSGRSGARSEESAGTSASVTTTGTSVTAAAEAEAGAGAEAEADARRGRRCGWCRRRLSIATAHSCRCGGRYCAPHRYAEVHGCAYDYKATALPLTAPPTKPKLPKI